MNSDDDKVTFQEIIGAVCKRPTMYTPTGSFYEIVSMLDGYGLGASVTPYHRTFTPFLQWAAGRFLGDDRFPIDWQEYLSHFSSETEAIEQLPRLYIEFATKSTDS